MERDSEWNDWVGNELNAGIFWEGLGKSILMAKLAKIIKGGRKEIMKYRKQLNNILQFGDV